MREDLWQRMQLFLEGMCITAILPSYDLIEQAAEGELFSDNNDVGNSVTFATDGAFLFECIEGASLAQLDETKGLGRGSGSSSSLPLASISRRAVDGHGPHIIVEGEGRAEGKGNIPTITLQGSNPPSNHRLFLGSLRKGDLIRLRDGISFVELKVCACMYRHR